MVTVPAFVWRFGIVGRAVLTGLGFAAPLAVLAWIDSGTWLTAVIVLAVLAVFFGVWMARRMRKFWPESKTLTGPERVLVARSARRGGLIADPRLAQPVLDYHRGLHASAEKVLPFRWLVWLVLSIGLAVTLWGAVFESPRTESRRASISRSLSSRCSGAQVRAAAVGQRRSRCWRRSGSTDEFCRWFELVFEYDVDRRDPA
jgi:hypothetical protein